MSAGCDVPCIAAQAVSGGMQLQVDKNGQILGTAGDVLGGMHIKGSVQKFRHALWGSQQSLQKKSSTPDLQRQSQTLPKEAGKSELTRQSTTVCWWPELPSSDCLLGCDSNGRQRLNSVHGKDCSEAPIATATDSL